MIIDVARLAALRQATLTVLGHEETCLDLLAAMPDVPRAVDPDAPAARSPEQLVFELRRDLANLRVALVDVFAPRPPR